VLEHLGDPSAERAYKRALELITPKEPCTLVYANFLGKKGRCGEAVNLLHPLIDAVLYLDAAIDERSRRLLVYLYCRGLRDLGRFDEVIAFCESVESADEILGGMAPFWISSLRQVRNLESNSMFQQCFSVAADCVRKSTPSPVFFEEVTKVLDDLVWARDHGRVTDATWLAGKEWADLLLRSLSGSLSETYDSTRFLEVRSRLQGELPSRVSVEENDLVTRGYIRATVARVPVRDGRTFPSYVFVRSDRGETFFCHRSSLSDTEIALWEDLAVMDAVWILPAAESEQGKSRKSLSTVILADDISLLDRPVAARPV
jgi:hypothetical protein